jgi:hypothetical protein
LTVFSVIPTSAAPLCGFQGLREAPVSPDLGGVSERDTPLPIPNRAVKPLSADGTWPSRAWESRSPPVFLLTPSEASALAGRSAGRHPARRAALAAPPRNRPLRGPAARHRGEARLRPGRNLAGTPRRPPGGRAAMWMLDPLRLGLGRRQAAQGGAQQRAGPARHGSGGGLGEHAPRLAKASDGSPRTPPTARRRDTSFRAIAGISWPARLQCGLQDRP